MNNIVSKCYEESNDIWGLPQKYKDLLLYPIKLIDKKYQNLFYNLLTYPKNSIADKETIKMSYLKFLYIHGMKDHIINNNLLDFLSYITHQNKISISEKIKNYPINSYSDFELELVVGDQKFSEYDFDNIREIILEQNGLSIEYVNEFNMEFEKSLEYIYKKNKMTNEDQISIYCILSGYNLEDVKNYTWYQFNKLYERLLIYEDYKLYQPLLTSGQVELKKGKIDHYGIHLGKKGRYDSMFINVDEFVDKNKGLNIPPINKK
jgi:hypothetical protein